MAYATAAQVTEYTGVDSLPDDIDRLIDRADELIDEAVLPNVIDTTDSDQATAAQNATCAQVEYWLNSDEEMDIINLPSYYTIGSYQVGSATRTQGQESKLAPRAKRILFKAGLLYRGVSAK